MVLQNTLSFKAVLKGYSQWKNWDQMSVRRGQGLLVT